MPPIIGHFHYCRSTLVYQIDTPRDKLNKKLNMEYLDITSNIINRNKKKYTIKEQKYYIDNNRNKYKVDGKHVIMKPTKKEKEVAKLLGEIYGGKVKLVPVVLNPKNIKTSDYIIKNEKFDLKEIFGNGNNTLDTAISKKKEQSNNFIFDISKTEMEAIEAIEQIKKIYKSKNRNWIDKIILIKNNEVLKVYKRK